MEKEKGARAGDGAQGLAWRPAGESGRATGDDWPALRRAWSRRLVVGAVLLACLAIFFRDAALSGFTQLYGDSYDGLIEIAILQHWHDVWVHGGDWLVTGYFHPYPGTLGYNDTYFLPGLFFSLARVAGADPFLAALSSHVAMKAIGFLGMYALLRQGAGVRFWLALAGAAIFATANASLLHLYHAQLLSVGLIPWLALAGIETVRAIATGRRRRMLAWGIGFGLLYGVTAFTAFYAAWFFAFFCLLFALVGPIVAGPARRAHLWKAARRHSLAVAALLAVAAVALIPLLIVYLPKVAQGARHPFDAGAGATTLGPEGLVNVGSGNLVWGWLLDMAVRASSGHGMAGGEARFGLPLGLLVMTVAALLWCIRNRATARLPLAIGTTLVLALMLMAEWPGGFTPFRLVYLVCPGADAIRVVSRFLLFALVPVIFIVMTILDRSRRRKGTLLLLVAFLLIEQVQLAAPLAMERGRQMAMLRDVGAPPAGCDAFFVVSARRDDAAERAEGARITRDWAWYNAMTPQLAEAARQDFAVYRHNVDAMLIATYYRRPTINGFSTFKPRDWAFADPQAADYPDRIRHYAAAHRLTRLCGLDMRRTPHWYPLTPAGAGSMALQRVGHQPAVATLPPPL